VHHMLQYCCMADTLKITQLYLTLTVQPALFRGVIVPRTIDLLRHRPAHGRGQLIAETVSKPDDASDVSFEGPGK
jgi:hypothetical protein